MSPGDRLRLMRHAAGHTQAEAARLVHASTNAWERWEGGSRTPPEAVVHLYALLTGQPYEPPGA